MLSLASLGPAAALQPLARTGLRCFKRPAMLILLLLAFGLRTYQLDSQSLRGDEAASVHYSAMPITELWELSRVTDPHPPFYYLMLHIWQWGLGRSAWAMRFAGVMASVVAVAALYGLARRTLCWPTLSLLAAGLLAINPLQIWLAQDIRSYPFFTLLGLLSAGALWRALRSSETTPGQRKMQARGFRLYLPRFRPWFLYILLTVASFYIHYYTVFLIAFEGLFVVANINKFWRDRWLWLVSQVVIGLLIIPGLLLAYNFVGQAAGGIETVATPDLLRLASTALLTGFTISDGWGLWLSLLLAPVWLVGLAMLLRRDFLSGLFWLLFFAAPVLGVILLSLGRPFFKERFLIQGQPAFELLLAAGFLSLASRASDAGQNGGHTSSQMPPGLVQQQPGRRFTFYTLRFGAYVLFLSLLFVNTFALRNYFADPVYAKAPPWRFYYDYVKDHARPHDVVLTNFPEAAVSYYSPEGLPFYVVPAERDLPATSRLKDTQAIAGAYRRIWFLPLLHQGFDEQGDVLNWLDRHADRVQQVFFPTYNLNLYLSPPAIEELMIPQPADFANGLHLRGYQILNTAGDARLTQSPAASQGEMKSQWVLMIKPKEEFTLSLYWLADGPTAVPYTVFIHLVAADGFTRTGQDNQPVWGTYPTTDWQSGEKVVDKYRLAIPEGAPAGDHRLQIGWYNSETQTRVPSIDAHGQPAEDFIILSAVIRVE